MKGMEGRIRLISQSPRKVPSPNDGKKICDTCVSCPGQDLGSPAKCLNSSVFLVQTLNKNPPKCLRLWIDHLRSCLCFFKSHSRIAYVWIIDCDPKDPWISWQKNILIQIITWNVETQVVTSWKNARKWKKSDRYRKFTEPSWNADVQAAHNILKWGQNNGESAIGYCHMCDLGRMAPWTDPQQGKCQN